MLMFPTYGVVLGGLFVVFNNIRANADVVPPNDARFSCEDGILSLAKTRPASDMIDGGKGRETNDVEQGKKTKYMYI